MAHFVKVLIVDQPDACRQNLRQRLEGTDGILVVGQADTFREGLLLARLFQPDVVLLGVRLWNGDGPLAPGGDLFQARKVLLLSERGQEAQTLQMLKWGAQGFLVKEDDLGAKLVEAIWAVQRGEAVLSPRLTGWMLNTVMH